MSHATMEPGSLALELRRLTDTGQADEVLRRIESCDDREVREAPEVELEAARAYARTGDLTRAMATATTALWGFRSRRDLRGQMRANLVLGGLAFEQGHPEAAEHHFGLARVLASALGDQTVHTQVTNNLACLALQKGDFAAAEGLYRSALAYAEALADLRAQAEVLHNLNLTYRGLGRFEDAKRLGEQAIAYGEQLEDWSLVALALGGLAETASWLDDADEGLLDRAEAAARRVDDPVREAHVNRVRAVLHLRKGRPVEAIELAARGRTLAAVGGAELLAAECLSVMAVAFKRSGNEAEANRLKEEATVTLYGQKAHRELDWFEREWSLASTK
ncbi:MAG: tetratricopeptide repeat protein [Gemmatimonadales bacterium]